MWFIPSLFGLLLVAFLAQEFAPLLIAGLLSAVPNDVWTMDVVARAMVMVVPMYFFSAAMTVSFQVMLALAFCTGLLWDCAFAFPVSSTDDGVFGISILLFGIIGSVMQGVRPLFARGRWEIPVVVVGCGVFVFMIFEFLVLCLSRADISFPAQVWVKVSVSTLMSMVLIPVVFWSLYRLATATGYDLSGATSGPLERRFH